MTLFVFTIQSHDLLIVQIFGKLQFIVYIYSFARASHYEGLDKDEISKATRKLICLNQEVKVLLDLTKDLLDSAGTIEQG